jgi:dTDP-4-amino-4,6-dideoxygalactose transaminase
VILCASPHAQYLELKGEIQAAIQAVLDSGYLILGEQVRAFEEEFAAFLGTKFFVGVGNGTDAIELALAAAGVGPGDEVITTTHTAVATVSAIVEVGAVPVLVDVEPRFYTLDPAKAAKAVTSKTKAIVPVHIYGQACDLDAFQALAKEKNLVLIEDCAQAHGARYGKKRLGSIGSAGCFSFYPTKNLGALGDGGGIATSDPALAEKLRLLRQYGWKERYVSAIHGRNTRLDELQAAILRVKLKHLEKENQTRRTLAETYREELASLKEVALPETRAGSEHVFHLFALLTEKRDALLAHLKKQNIQTMVHYPMPVHLQPGYAKLARFSAMPEAEKVAQQELSLPMHPYLRQEDVLTVCKEIRAFFR